MNIRILRKCMNNTIAIRCNFINSFTGLVACGGSAEETVEEPAVEEAPAETLSPSYNFSTTEKVSNLG